jgi:hypothetical protein
VVPRRGKHWSVITDGKQKKVRQIKFKDGKSAISVLESIEQCNEQNDAAHAAILARAPPESQDIVSSCADELESARIAWDLFEEKFD